MSQIFTLGWLHRPNIVPTLTFCHFQLDASFWTNVGRTLGQRSIFNKLSFKINLARGLMLGKRNAFNIKHNQIMFLETSRPCTLAQRWINVVFSTTFIQNQSDKHTLVQRWAKVLIPTRFRSDCQWQNVNVGAMLGQRCTSNPSHRPTVLPYPNVGPT